MSEESENVGRNDKVVAKEQRIFMRILGLFLILYGFLILSQPQQYGLGISLQYTPILGIIFVLIGAFLALKK